ncbi:MAG: tetraacyldisaccharide 4'-kinase [Phycisphaerae bacterium]
MSVQSFYHRLVAGEGGVWAVPVRGALRAGEGVFACGVALRNRWYDRRGPTIVLQIPVVSVGNLTVGGTGKTPIVIDIARRLEQMGFSPAVVSRGYRATTDEPNDEERLIRAECPGVICLADPDRIRAAELAHARLGADVIVLDDGFQHRRLGRTIDIVVIDATCPFGYGHLLPRGLLRELINRLSRADVVIITRCDQVSPDALSRLQAKIRTIVHDVATLCAVHRVTGIESLNGAAIHGSISGKRVVLFAGIGRPQAFETTVRSLGAEVVGTRWWPDHHRYGRRDIDSILKSKRLPPFDLLLTTQKDAVKLNGLGGLEHAAIACVKIAIEFTGADGTILQSVLERSLPKS